ncbi:hypothetical protein AAHZ94_33285, partial [Streptomyces sp. HSW2009]
MSSTLRIEQTADGLCVLTPLPGRPARTPSVLDPEPGVDVALLEVAGGHLTWSVLDAHREPVAVLDEPAAAQGWVWALYGEPAALALAVAAKAVPGPPVEVPVSPGLPELAADARSWAYAQWAARWWPASSLDAVPALDARALADDLARLAVRCDLLGAPREPYRPTGYGPPDPGALEPAAYLLADVPPWPGATPPEHGGPVSYKNIRAPQTASSLGWAGRGWINSGGG